MNILDRIIEQKKTDLADLKTQVSSEELKDQPAFSRDCYSLTESLLKSGATGIIAEFKRKSPSKGFINQDADAAKITRDYTRYGASGLSVLTDNFFFGGSTADLIAARVNEIPILRKDFMIDPYQLFAAKAMGADVILLIAACLTISQVQELAGIAKELGLEVLLELHEEDELGHICDDVDMVGINNRSLKTFEVDINRSLQLSKLIPESKIKIAESGISDPTTISLFRDAGYYGFLVGEAFMKTQDPGKAFKSFVDKIEK